LNAVQAASRFGHPAVVGLLLDRGADLNAKGDIGKASAPGICICQQCLGSIVARAYE